VFRSETDSRPPGGADPIGGASRENRGDLRSGLVGPLGEKPFQALGQRYIRLRVRQRRLEGGHLRFGRRLPLPQRRHALAQLLQREELLLIRLDVPRDRFLTAGDAWRALRGGIIDAETCGVSFIPVIRGAWFVGASILRDLAALNAREMLPWDYWGLARAFSGPGTTIPPAAASRLNEIAAITAGLAPSWPALRATFETANDLRVPATVLSFPGGKPIEVPV
jgi:hypothetical protein